MSSQHGTPAGSARRSPKPQRILACVLCQQRKVKCDRKFPCNHCIKAKVQCVPATQMPRRRRRPTEQELIDRLRRYEDLLHQNNIAIESTDDVDTEEQPASIEPGGPQSTGHTYFDMTAGTVGSSGTAKKIKSESQTLGEVKNFWDVMHQRATDNQNHTEKATVENNFENPTFDDLSEPVIVKVWGRVFENDHNHLFGPSKIDVSLCNLHPSHVHIFRFWQVYSDRINPLLKVTHAPTLQASILDAAADVAGRTRELEALMFSIYCVALISLDEGSCRSMFGESKKVLLKRYQDACHQALINCGFLKSRERDCLTAFFLYLVSLRPDTHPHSLSPMFAIAFRIAYRMNIPSEDANAKHGVFEAEMRRRLWWAMVTYDSRISEMTDYKTTQLIPTWDCHVPANVNDFDLRPEMTTRPTNQEASTEALFAVIRGEIGNSIRHNALHLDFINPMLKHIAKATQHLFDPHDDNLHSLEASIETRLAHCNPEIPLHYMTLWWTRSYLAKYRFFLHCSHHARSPAHQTTPQRSAILSHALRMLECDTALLASPLTAPYRWLLHFHFPFPAYVRIVQDLKARPLGPHADNAWAVMTANYAVRFADMEPSANLLFKMFASTVLQAWAARRAALIGQADAGAPHSMIADIQRKLGQAEPLLRGGDEVPDVQGGLLAAERRGLNLMGQGQETLDFPQDPGFAELNADLFDWDWANVDCIAMPGLAWP